MSRKSCSADFRGSKAPSRFDCLAMVWTEEREWRCDFAIGLNNGSGFTVVTPHLSRCLGAHEAPYRFLPRRTCFNRQSCTPTSPPVLLGTVTTIARVLMGTVASTRVREGEARCCAEQKKHVLVFARCQVLS